MFQQVTVAGHGLFEGVHYLGANQMLRRNHVLEIVGYCLFEHVARRLPVLLCNGDPSRRLRLVLGLLADPELLKGRRMAIDATTLEANAAMRSIVRRDTGASYEEFLRGLAQGSGIQTPTREELARLDRKRNKRIGRADAALERGSTTGARGVRQLRNRS